MYALTDFDAFFFFYSSHACTGFNHLPVWHFGFIAKLYFLTEDATNGVSPDKGKQ